LDLPKELQAAYGITTHETGIKEDILIIFSIIVLLFMTGMGIITVSFVLFL
jgi:hypothetical protein